MKLSVHSQTIGREAEKVNGDDEAKSEDLPVKTSIGFFGQRNFREIIAYVARLNLPLRRCRRSTCPRTPLPSALREQIHPAQFITL